MKFAYSRGGGPLLDWSSGPPRQTRAADATALGSLGTSSLSGPTLVLPAPGAPEPIGVSNQAMGGCSCSGSCGCGTGSPLGDIASSVPGGYVTILAVAGLVAWKLLRKR